MKRRTLDILFSAGGITAAVLLLVFGFVLKGEADFATDYVADQLGEQAIYFTPAEFLSEEEAEAECLVEYGTGEEADRLMQTGEQAECYANHYIGLHVSHATGGLSYAELGTPQRALRAQITEAKEANADNVEELEAELAAIDGQRETAFKGETLRGLLLTTYGFSIIGAKAALAATVAFIAAGLMAVLSIAGFFHAFRTPETEAFAPVPKD